MSLNIWLLRETLAAIEAHPEQHHQGDFRCRSGMCFAGWAAQLAGGVWLVEEPVDPGELAYRDVDLLKAELDDGDDAHWNGAHSVVSASLRARRVLGLTGLQADLLFNGLNTVEQLRELVDEFARDEEVAACR